MFDPYEVIGGRRVRQHNLAKDTTGNYMMAYQGETPWHQLGQKVASMATVKAALEAAHLDWDVELRDLFFCSGSLQTDPQFVKIPMRKAVVKSYDQKPLGTVGSGYSPIQNRDGFAILDDVCAEHGVTIESAGAVDDGAKVWMLAKMPGQSAIAAPGGPDAIDNYFLTVMAHDGSRAQTARLTRERVVCRNTMAVALAANATDVVRVIHTKNAEARLKVAAKVVSTMVSAIKASDEVFTKLAETRLNPKEIVSYFNEVLGIEEEPTVQQARVFDRLVDLTWNGKGAQLAGADENGTTAWGAYNAVTEYVDHVYTALKTKPKYQLRAAESAIFGGMARKKDDALLVARRLADRN